MALIICPECGKQFSDKAAACPNCGCPTSEIVKSQPGGGVNWDVEKQMLDLVEDTLAKAREAGTAFELASDKVQEMANTTTIDLYSDSARRDTSHIVKAAVDACDALYSAYQALIPTLDGACRPLLAKNPGAKAVRAVAGTMAWLNEESEIENNYAVSFNGADLGDAVKAKYIPSPLNRSIQGFWEGEYRRLPNRKEADACWQKMLSGHKSRLAQEENTARKEKLNEKKQVEQIYEDMNELTEADNRSFFAERENNYKINLSDVLEKMKYFRPAAGLISHVHNAGASVLENGGVHIEDNPLVLDSSTKPDDLSDMHDICQVIAINACGFIGLRRDGSIATSRLGSETKQKFNFQSILKWKNIRKIVKTINTDEIIGLCWDGTCVNTPGPFSHIDVKSWNNVIDIVAGSAFVAGLCADGTVCVSGVSSEGYDLEKAGEWKNIVLLAVGHFELIAVNNEGRLLQIGKENLNYLEKAKDIMAIAYGGDKYYVLQSDGTVIGGVRDFYSGLRSELIQGLHDIVGIYGDPKHNGCIALQKDGSILFFGDSGRRTGVQDHPFYFKTPLLQNYEAYQKKENVRTDSLERNWKQRREEETLRADRRAKNLCQYCGGELEKKLFGWKCKVCGKKKDY